VAAGTPGEALGPRPNPEPLTVPAGITRFARLDNGSVELAAAHGPDGQETPCLESLEADSRSHACCFSARRDAVCGSTAFRPARGHPQGGRLV